jgi:outer membrane biosynthesis protein TonB
MDSYTITIAPNDDSGNTTTLIVDTSGDEVRITDVHLHATDGLTGGQMPTVDFRLLLRAITTPTNQIEATPDAAPAIADEPARTEAQEPIEAREPTEAPEPTAAGAPQPQTATTPRPRRAKRTTTADPTPEPAAPPRARRAPHATAKATATNPSAKRAGGATTAARKKLARTAAPTTTGGRAYRRMPEDLAAVYQQVGTPAAIAEHYGVPRHTAQGWIRRVKATNATTAES